MKFHQPLFSLFFLLFIFFFISYSSAQQPYINNVQNNCYSTNSSSALGYTCNGLQKSCNTFLTYRSRTNYQNPVLIAYLLNTNSSSISQLNQLPDTSSFINNDLVLIPTTCSCSNSFYQHNATYNIKSTGETYLLIANDTYGGLTTCQALIDQNSYNSRNLTAGMKLNIPIRCACPTANQTRLGVKYLLNYLVTWGDDVPTISARFHADYQSVLDANGLSSESIVYPFTTLLVPIKTEPSKDELVTPPPPAAAPQPDVSPPADDDDDKGSSNEWVFIGVGVGVFFLVLCGIVGWYCFWFRRRRVSSPPVERKQVEESIEYGDKSGKEESAAFVSSEIRSFLESLTVYKFADLEKATGFFGEDYRIKGSVYRAVINGDTAAIKRLKGDVSSEIKILKQINHANVVRLSGFCVHEGNTYLVYEYAEKGSLSDWLHHKKDVSDLILNWAQRVRIAYDIADGLNYLHNYANPPYIHKNLKSSNILLDAEFRAKLANFGLARAVDDYERPQLTRHVVGTQGYMAPEYLEHGLITPKLDVFAFGVVILELLSGKEATFAKDGDEKGELLLSASIEKVLSGEDLRNKLKSFLDPWLENDYPFDLAFAMAELAKRCVGRDVGSRPDMTEVFMSLTAIYNSTMDWDPSDVGNSGSVVEAR